MQLTKEHVGRRASYCGQKAVILAAAGDHVWVQFDGKERPETYGPCAWELVEEPKPEKNPSERIQEIKRENGCVAIGINVQSWEYAIIRFLDEQHEQAAKK